MKYFTALLLLVPVLLCAQNTVGLISKKSYTYLGYTLFAPVESSSTYLINNDGLLMHSWVSDHVPGQSVYLMADGSLLRTEMLGDNRFSDGAGAGGRIKKISWDGETLWQLDYADENYIQHHDIEMLPNGNILLIAWEAKSVAEAIQAGRDPNYLYQGELWPDYLVEFFINDGNQMRIAWEWHAWDHLIQDFDASKENYGDVAAHPELIDINYMQDNQNDGIADWLHTNSVDYNAELDQIMLSVRNFSEVWIIDHSTTTAEAAGHSGGRAGKGGDLLYRFGNPQAFGHGDVANRFLYLQHQAEWIPDDFPGAGHVLLFNNGDLPAGRPYSTVDEYILPMDAQGNYTLIDSGIFRQPALHWFYAATRLEDFFGINISGAQRLPNGNTLVCNGPLGSFFEVTPAKEIVWQYVNPITNYGPMEQGSYVDGGVMMKNNRVFRCARFPRNYAAFVDKELAPSAPLELYPAQVAGEQHPQNFALQNYPNPFNPITQIHFTLQQPEHIKIEIFNAAGKHVQLLWDGELTAGSHAISWHAENFASGVYYYRLSTENFSHTKKMTVMR